MMMPCEVIVRYYLPAMRYKIAKELMENYGWTQVEVSDRLRITQAAVSKYMGGKLDDKAKNFSKMKEVKNAARKIAKEIAEERKRSDSIGELCQVCNTLRREGKLCRMHLDMKNLKECNCNICLSR
jgi:predicted transcriptional regulator